MFKRRTLFILGAGASAEVGLPVGIDLAKTIANLLDIRWRDGQKEGPGDRFLMGQFVDQRRVQVSAHHQAAWLIRDGVRLTNSIDDFLDIHNSNDLVRQIGKAAIVKAILGAERESKLYYDQNKWGTKLSLDDLEATWYVKFIRMLGRGINQSNAREVFDKVAFIVFNYDRCLEFFLIDALHLLYSIPTNEAASIVGDLDVMHPYGLVGELPALNRASAVPFGGTDNFDYDYVKLSDGIKTYTEQIASADILSQIHEQVSRAERIVLLGFGYHDQNILMLTPSKKLPLKPVIGTALGMSESDINVVREQLAGIFAGSVTGTLPAMQISDRTSADLLDYYTKTLPN